jgi:hypothetical protein
MRLHATYSRDIDAGYLYFPNNDVFEVCDRFDCGQGEIIGDMSTSGVFLGLEFLSVRLPRS